MPDDETMPRIPAIKPEWRTSTVMALCAGIRETGDYQSTMPILADALMDAGCDDTRLLGALRGHANENPVGCADDELVGVIMSDDVRTAIEWVSNFACNDLGDSRGWGDSPQIMNYAVLMTAARAYQDGKDYASRITQFDTDTWQDIFHSNADQFWRNYELITGQTVPDRDAGFISCSC